MTEKPEYRMRLIGNHQNHAAIINMFAADGYELVTALPATDSDYRCIFRLRPATDAADQTQRERMLAQAEQNKTCLIRLDNLEARLDGLPEQLGKSERVLLDRIEALESLHLTRDLTVKSILDRIEKLEARLLVDPGTRTVVCPTCKGMGTATYPTNQEQYIAVSCQVCHGTGRVPA